LDERSVATAFLLACLDQPLILRRGEKDESVAPLLVDTPTLLLQPQLVAIEVERLIEVANAEHGVQISHGVTSLHRLDGKSAWINIHDRKRSGECRRRPAEAHWERAQGRPVHGRRNFYRVWHSR